MNSNILFLVILTFFIDEIFSQLGGPSYDPDSKRVDISHIGQYGNCEGRDAANYSVYFTNTRDIFCSQESLNIGYDLEALLQVLPNGQRGVSQLISLARSIFPQGANVQGEFLWFAKNGPLEGKYIYEKGIYGNVLFLKKCSSKLGLSFTASKSGLMLVNDKLDVNALINPSGAFEQFKKGCTTICKGSVYHV